MLLDPSVTEFTSAGTNVADDSFMKGTEAQFGWNTKADGTGVFLEGGEKVPVGVKDLYAWYSPYMSINYPIGGEEVKHTSDISVTLSGHYRGADYSRDLGKYDMMSGIYAMPIDSEHPTAKLTFTDGNAKNVKVTTIGLVDVLQFEYDDCTVTLTIMFFDQDSGKTAAETTFSADPSAHSGSVSFTPDKDVVIMCKLYAEI